MDLNDYFIYDGIESQDYGFYASGEATYNTPEKEYDVYEIPGRSGDLEVFNGRFKNTQLVYRCIYQMTGGDFAEDFGRFRAALLSRNGYKRLQDTHHPYEYRLAVCKNAIEVDPTEHGLVAEVEIVFDCKPQRYLTVGESAVEVASGDIITNPTQFESRPMLEVYGYDGISINLNDTDDTISINDRRIGKVKIGNSVTSRNAVSPPGSEGASMTTDRAQIVDSKFKTTLLNTGDKVWFSSSTKAKIILGIPYPQNWSATIGRTNVLPYTLSVVSSKTWGLVAYLTYDDKKGDTCSFSYGTQNTNTYTDVIGLRITADNNTYEYQFPIAIIYHGADTITTNMVLDDMNSSGAAFEYIKMPEISGYSSKRTLGDPADPIFIDLETGVAYKNEPNTYVPVNSAVWLGAQLPTLKPGNNTVTYSGHVNQLRIIPRWWTI